MKAKILCIICLLSFMECVAQENNSFLSYKDLPSHAQDFINRYFSNEMIDFVKLKSDDRLVEIYKVQFAAGQKIAFDRKGKWVEIICPYGVPNGIIQKKVLSQIKVRHPKKIIVSLRIENPNLIVKLDDQTVLLFGSNQRLIEP